MDLRTRIKRWMDIRGIKSVNYLAGLASLTQSTLNNIMSGRNLTATTRTIEKICDGLGITVNDFWRLPDTVNNCLTGKPSMLSEERVRMFLEDYANRSMTREVSNANTSNIIRGEGGPPFKSFGAIIDRAIEAGVTPEELEEGLDYVLFTKKQKQGRKGDSQ